MGKHIRIASRYELGSIGRGPACLKRPSVIDVLPGHKGQVSSTGYTVQNIKMNNLISEITRALNGLIIIG